MTRAASLPGLLAVRRAVPLAGLAALLWLAVVGLAAVPAAAQGNDDCYLCHDDPELLGSRNGREISVYVDRAAFDDSVHAFLDCTSCHLDVDPDDLPHADDLERVDCGLCHGDVAEEHAGGVHGSSRDGRLPAASCSDCHGVHDIAPPAGRAVGCATCHPTVTRLQQRSLHGQAAARGDELAPTCVVCHGAHDILAHRDPAAPTAVMNVPLLCGGCHREGTEVSRFREIPQEAILEHYVDSIHGEGLFQKGLTVTAVCTSCHTSHDILPHTDPRSSIHADNVARTCTQCHGQIERVHRQVIEGRLWEEEPHKIPVCVDCHEPHEIRRVFYSAGMANQDCLSCHARPELAAEGAGGSRSMYVDPQAYALSAHAGTACAQCHTEVSVTAVDERPCATILSPVDCSVCHAAQVEQYGISMHGQLAAAGDPDAPHCLDCHDDHATQLKTLPTSPTYARNVPLLCARCHRAGEQAAVRIDSGVPDLVQSYIDSIHGKGLLESGLVVTATCVNCHSSHGELPASDPRSTVHPDNIAHTCGTCHHGIEETFLTSIHATGEPGDDFPLPNCESCHTSHTISRTDRPGFRTAMMNQCGHCHETEAETFFDTFHGKVSRLGSEGAAKCYDCHGTHDILPVTDPASRLSRANVVETCGQCHEGSHRRFAGYLTHATHHDPDRYPWLFWSFWFMTALLVGTLTFALLHTVAWLVRLWLSRDQWRAHKALSKTNDKPLYRRFNRFQRLLHITMMLSFFVLALTGMALKFSYAGWAQGIARVLGGSASMGVLHRLGALTLIVVFVVHLVDVWRKKRSSGRSWRQMITGSDSILFNRRDLTEAVQSIRWFFGLGPRPRYGRYTYWEKFDYFAVFWGVMVIGSTGMVLWFPELFTYALPGWSINVATIIHSDEALLAVAFIFTIHFFNTHFRPDKFPMDPVIFTGRVTLEELKYDKPREYEELVARGELEEHLVQPFNKSAEKGARIFGFIALAVGLTLLAMIVFAMLVSYQ